jgi:uncharacterized protein (TIGR02452 family)
MAKQSFIDMFNTTIEDINNGKYRDFLEPSFEGSILYKDIPEVNGVGCSPDLIFSDETTLVAAKKSGIDNICVLNFASATTPGGGVMYGAAAQEESICRSSTLMPCLFKHEEFYLENKKHQPLYLDWAIYTPNVAVIKDEFTGELYDKPFKISVVTSPAPCLRDVDTSDINLDEIYERRIHQILSIMEFHGHENIVLGAWGCGAFRNDPEKVSAAFVKCLISGNYSFRKVYFPIFGNANNLKVFKDSFIDIL